MGTVIDLHEVSPFRDWSLLLLSEVIQSQGGLKRAGHKLVVEFHYRFIQACGRTS